MYIISACLLGHNCKYNGGNNRHPGVLRFADRHSFCTVCPESMGGLMAPREPAERIADKVMSRSGEDWSEAFLRGACHALRLGLEEAERRGEPLEGAILKANSPSCGYGRIYDGTFSGTLKDGDGCFAELLRKRDLPIVTEHTFDEIKEK